MKEDFIYDDFKYWSEENIPFFKEALYDMDTLTEDENTEAKKILSSKITTKISIVERLLLMIRIKEQIVGRKKRIFYVEKSYKINDVTGKEVFAKLVDGKIELSGGINKILYPKFEWDFRKKIRQKSFIEGYYEAYNNYGYWKISRNFKELSYHFYSDKNWEYEKL